MLRYWPLKYIFSFPWSVFLSNCFRILITGCPLTSAKQRSKGEQKFIKAVQQDTWLVVPDVLPILAFLCFSFQVLASHQLPQSQCPEVHRSWWTIFIKKNNLNFSNLSLMMKRRVRWTQPMMREEKSISSDFFTSLFHIPLHQHSGSTTYETCWSSQCQKITLAMGGR